jgi:hypothetical protein
LARWEDITAGQWSAISVVVVAVEQDQCRVVPNMQSFCPLVSRAVSAGVKKSFLGHRDGIDMRRILHVDMDAFFAAIE